MKYRVIAVFLVALLLGTIEACSEKSGFDSNVALKSNLDSVAKEQFRARPIIWVHLTAVSLGTGKAPGRPKQTGQV